MRALRRPQYEHRVEIMPLIDVIFLLLTFFIYAMVLMVRADVLPVTLHAVADGRPAERVPTVTVTIDRTGALFVDREPVAPDQIVETLKARVAEAPDTEVWVGAEEGGDADRLPAFLDLYERLAPAGLTVRLAGPPR